MVKIYALVSDGKDYRYVGRTSQSLKTRLRQHIYKSKKKGHSRALWIRDRVGKGAEIRIVLLEIVPRDFAREAEIYWTNLLIERGFDLVNDGIGRGGCESPKRKAAWTPQLDAMLGQVADSVIAERMGVTRKTVSYRRDKLGISASFNRSRNTPPPPMGGHNKIDLPQDVISKLGTMSDAKLGRLAGVSKKRIMKERHKLNIPSWSHRNGHPTRYRNGDFPERWLKDTG